MVDDARQVIVAAQVSDCAADVANLIPMTGQATSNTVAVPKQVLAEGAASPAPAYSHVWTGVLS